MRSGLKCWWRCQLELLPRSSTSNTASRGRVVVHHGQCQGGFGMLVLGCCWRGPGHPAHGCPDVWPKAAAHRSPSGPRQVVHCSPTRASCAAFLPFRSLAACHWRRA